MSATKARATTVMGIAVLVGGLANAAVAQTAIIRTIAGGGASDPGDDGLALDAQLATPGGVARDAAGNLYIADTGHHRIRKVSAATGAITTIAGTGVGGYNGDGGSATASLLNSPSGVAVDAAGNVYIADTGNHCVRRVLVASGVIERLAGIPGVAGYNPFFLPPAATENPLDHPTGVAVDARGVVYVADRDNHRIRTVSGGVMSTFAGNSFIPDRPPFKTSCPIDNYFPWIHQSPIGGYGGDGGPAGGAELRCPSGVTVDTAGNVYIADTSNDAIRKVTASTGIISTVAGGHWYTNLRLGYVWFDCSLAGDGGPATAAYLCRPTGVATEASGTVYIADTGNHRIRSIARTGLITTLAGSGIDSTGLYPVGASGFAGDDGLAANARLNRPSALAVDPDGNLYLADGGNNRIRSIGFGDVPLAGDIDGDGATDLIAWRHSSGTWYWLTSSSGYDYGRAGARQWGDASRGDMPLVGDIDGDRLSDLIVWRASTGTWYWLTSSSGYAYESAGTRVWGDAAGGDVPLVGDIDGDGRSDLIVWRATTGTWYWLTSSSGYAYSVGADSRPWGDSTLGDKPLLTDVDGDGRADLTVWRASTGTWYSAMSSLAYDPWQPLVRHWGDRDLGDVPLAADVDGDGRTDLCIWRATTGTWYWLLSRTTYDAAVAEAWAWGSAAHGDVPIVTDMDADRLADLAVWRASTGTWYWLPSSTYYAYASAGSKAWGSSGGGLLPR